MTGVRKYFKDPFPGISHFVGAALSIVAMIVLIQLSAGSSLRITAFAIYGASMILLYLASAINHSLHCGAKVDAILERIDYMAIFLLIAGTYTPVCLIGIPGPLAWAILAAEWIMAAVGIGMVIANRTQSHGVRALMYVIMGWMALIAVTQLTGRLPASAVVWLVVGGVVYSLGAIVYVTNRPHIWPGWFNAHDLWHSMVLAGSTCHFLVMLAIIGVAK